MACQHRYVPSAHPGYEKCSLCGTHHSLVATPEGFYGADYWSLERGHSTIYEQIYNVEVHREGGVSKHDFVCRHITAEGRDFALEVGCAPGSMLSRLQRLLGFDRVVGVEVDPGEESAIRSIGNFHGELLFGFFPGVTADLEGGEADLVLGLDVFEHSDEPEAFLAECRRLLKPGGELVLMVPLLYPRDVNTAMFCPGEHMYLHGWANISALLEDAGLRHTASDQWARGHELVVARKPELPLPEVVQS